MSEQRRPLGCRTGGSAQVLALRPSQRCTAAKPASRPAVPALRLPLRGAPTCHRNVGAHLARSSAT